MASPMLEAMFPAMVFTASSVSMVNIARAAELGSPCRDATPDEKFSGTHSTANTCPAASWVVASSASATVHEKLFFRVDETSSLAKVSPSATVVPSSSVAGRSALTISAGTWLRRPVVSSLAHVSRPA